jgi:tetratricopeptide (TPR) repeat protein
MAGALEKARITFTGKMASMPRSEAWGIVLANGGEPAKHVSHRTTMLVIGAGGWPILSDGQVSRKVKRAEELQSAGCPIRIVPESEFLALTGRTPAASGAAQRYSATDVCRIMGIDSETLRRWERLGLLHSQDGCYDFRDLVSIHRIHDLIGTGIRPERIAKSLNKLATFLPDLERPLAQLQIFAENERLLLVDLQGMRLSSSGQLHLDFEGDSRRTGVLLQIDPHDRTAEEWFALGCSCEEEGLYSEACEAFRTVLAMEPDSSTAYCHLGEIMREMGILWAAEELFATAARMEAGVAAPWLSLAAIQEEQGKIEDAVASYQTALAISPDNADGHFNLALCYEKAGRPTEGFRHWFEYLKLDSTSPSAQVAKRHLSVCPTH